MRNTIPWAFNQLDAIHMSNGTFSLHTHLAAYPLYQSAISTLRGYTADFDVFRNICCQRIMIAESYIPQKLRYEVQSRCIELYTAPNTFHASTATSSTSSTDPITRLALDVYRKCYVRQPFSLSSQTYFPELNPPILYTDCLDIYPREELPYYERIANIAGSAVAYWFNFPTGLDSDIRAYLVQCIVESLGHSALLLPITWAVYEEAPPWLLNSGHKKRGNSQRQVKFRQDMMESLKLELESSEAAKYRSSTNKLLQLLGLHYKSYMLRSKVRPAIFCYYSLIYIIK